MAIITLFILGLLFGSFANVCIYRIPRDESVVSPPSHCPVCGNAISWFDNIPVISYLFLGAKCRHCSTPISARYPIIELATAVSFAIPAWYFPLTPGMAVYLYYAFVLVVITVIDIEHFIIPDVFSLSLIVVGFAGSAFNYPLGATVSQRLLNSLYGILLGGGGLLLVGYVAEKVLKKEAMGGGDIKLLAGIGAVLGWQRVFSTLFVASLLGSIVGIYLIATKRMKRTEYLPFGPYLAVAAYANLFLPADLRWVFMWQI